LKIDLPVKRKRPDLRELILECGAANIDFLLRSLNDKQFNELKPLFSIFMTHLLIPTYEVGQVTHF
jgi:hypothetical protein